MTEPANDNGDKLAGACPICSKSPALKYKPFCSKRCADVDLARWLGGRYAIPAVETDDEDEEPLQPVPRGSRPRDEG